MTTVYEAGKTVAVWFLGVPAFVLFIFFVIVFVTAGLVGFLWYLATPESTINWRAASSSPRPNRNLESRSGLQASGRAKHPSDAQPSRMAPDIKSKIAFLFRTKLTALYHDHHGIFLQSELFGSSRKCAFAQVFKGSKLTRSFFSAKTRNR
jgi:hypothetical protein